MSISDKVHRSESREPVSSEGMRAEAVRQLDHAAASYSSSKDGMKDKAKGAEKSYPQSLEMTPIAGYDSQKGGAKEAGLRDWFKGLRQRWLYPDMGDGGRYGWDWEKGQPRYHSPGYDPIEL